MVFDPEACEEPVRDGQKKKEEVEVEMERESESDGEKEREEEEESRTESARELNGGMKNWRSGSRGEDGSLADDEAEDDDEEEEEDDDDEGQAAHAFTPLVTILQPVSTLQDLNESSAFLEEPEEKVQEPEEEQLIHTYQHIHHQPEVTQENIKPKCGCGSCGEIVVSSVCLLAAAVVFPLFLWLGYEFLPIDIPRLSTTPFRLLYTLRCAFFAALPIILGVLVQGVSRVKFGVLKPMFEGNRGTREVVVHGQFVRDSLHLYLIYFLQLAVTATYIRHDLIKLVPLLTIIFCFGRLIYWVCLVFRSSVRSLGFGLSFLPVLVLLGANLYFICSSTGPDAVFDVAPPTSAPPPKQRWWG